MIKKHLLGGVLLASVLVLLTGCKEMMSSLDNPVSAYLKVDPASTKIYRGQSYKIPYSTISDAKPIFKSADEKVAVVDENGVVTGANRGTTKISITLPATDYYNGASAEFTVEVDALLNLPKDAKELALNEVYNLGVTSVSTGSITYKSSDTKVATVDADGNVTAKGYGDATITISIAATPQYDRTETAEFAATVRIQDLDQLKAAIAASDEVTALLSSEKTITINESLDLSGKKVSFKGASEKASASITISESIKINSDFSLENLNIDGTGLGNSKPLIQMVTTTNTAKKKDGSASTVLQFGDIEMKNVKMSNLQSSVISSALKGFMKKINIEDCIIEFSGNKNIFDLGSSTGASTFADEFIVKNSTLYSKTGHTGKFIKCDARPKNDLGYGANDKVAVTLDHVTMYQISKGQQMNNSNGQMKGQAYMHQTMKSCILVYSGNHSAAVRGWMFGQNSNANAMVYDKNTYWNDADFSATWTNSENQGYDASGTALTTDPNFKDVANAIFTPQGADQVANQTGDPRWYKVN